MWGRYEPTERERRVAGERSSSVPFHLHSVPSFFRPVVPEEVRNRATDVRNERGREGPNDEGTKGTGERDGSEGDTVTRALANHPSLVSLLSPSVPFGSFHSPAARMMSGASNVSDVRRRGRDRREPDEPRQEKDERNRRKPHERWEAYGSFLIIGWAGGGCNRSLTCFRRVIVTHFLSPSFPHVLHSSLHCVSRLVTLRSEDGNVSDGRWAWVTRERHEERDTPWARKRRKERMNEWRVSLLARLVMRERKGPWSERRAASRQRGSARAAHCPLPPPHLTSRLSPSCRPPGRAPPDPTVRRRYERWERDTNVA